MTQPDVLTDCLSESLDDRLAEVLASHFDPKHGSPFWIQRAAAMDINPLRDIHSIQDLARFGTMSPGELVSHPIEAFVPRTILQRRNDLIVAQTGGTISQGVWTAYRPDEFEAAFVTPFVVAARHVHFPEEAIWLYVGPSGPHIIGLAAQHLARAFGAMSPFTVDFDSRWAKKLSPGSFAARRYLDHVVQQAMDIVSTQDIGVLFSTPPILQCLAERMSVEQRLLIRGVHYGGLALTADDLHRFQKDLFPNAVHLSGYGNTLFGCALELEASPRRSIRYYPHGQRLLMGILRNSESGSDVADYHAVGQRGPLVFTRLDHTCLLINVVERDEVTLVTPPANAPDGFAELGAESPSPIKRAELPAQNLLY